MAKRGRNLAALAALGALGYMATRNKSPEKAAATPVEDRVGTPVRPAAAPAAAPATFVDELEMADRRYRENPVVVPAGPRVSSAATSSPMRSTAPARAAAAVPMEVPSRGRREMLKNPQRGPSMADIQQKNEEDRINALRASGGMRAKGGAIKMASGGMTASKRADGCAQRGKTKGRMV